MGFKDLDKTFVFGATVLDVFHLIAARTKGTAGGVLECRDGSRRFLTGVDEVFVQSTEDAILTGVKSTNFIFVLTTGFDNATCRGVDNRRYAARLCVERILLSHRPCFATNPFMGRHFTCLLAAVKGQTPNQSRW